MLQQTRANVVQRRYPAFMERFPTLAILADAPLDSVLAEWQGLGYYGRARNLHRAAREVMGRGEGALPKTRDALLALPGIGPYMAGAIASIAFGEPHPAVDANALRIMSRVLNLSIPVNSPPGLRIITDATQVLIPSSRPGDFNQALMELGAQICAPRKPRCTRCPISELCAGQEAGTQGALPVKTKKKPPTPVTIFQFWARRKGRILLTQREKNGLFGGMWELPGFMEDGRCERIDPRRLDEECAKVLGRGWRPGRELAQIQRTLTHRKILFVVLLVEISDEKTLETSRDGFIWASEEDMDILAISSAQRAAWRAAKRALSHAEEKAGGRYRGDAAALCCLPPTPPQDAPPKRSFK